MRKDTRPSPPFRTASNGKLGGAWERGYSYLVPLVEMGERILQLQFGIISIYLANTRIALYVS